MRSPEVFLPELAKTTIPQTTPHRREVPETPNPLPARKPKPIVEPERVRTTPSPRQPVSVR